VKRGPRVLGVFMSPADLCVFVRKVLIGHGFYVRSTCSFRIRKILLRVGIGWSISWWGEHAAGCSLEYVGATSDGIGSAGECRCILRRTSRFGTPGRRPTRGGPAALVCLVVEVCRLNVQELKA